MRTKKQTELWLLGILADANERAGHIQQAQSLRKEIASQQDVIVDWELADYMSNEYWRNHGHI